MPTVQTSHRIQHETRSLPKPLVSHSSILILSGFLVGVASGRLTAPAEFTVFAAGVLGFVAYLAVGRVARKRQVEAAESAQQLAARNLETRIDRHIDREYDPPSCPLFARRRDFDRQYLTVATPRRTRMMAPPQTSGK